MADTGKRVAQHLEELLRGSGAVHKAYRQIPFIIPINFQCTLMEPAKSIYERLQGLEGGEVATVSFSPGFPAADIHDCGAAVFAYGTSQAAAQRAVDALADEIVRREAEWTGKIYDPAVAGCPAAPKG